MKTQFKQFSEMPFRGIENLEDFLKGQGFVQGEKSNLLVCKLSIPGGYIAKIDFDMNYRIGTTYHFVFVSVRVDGNYKNQDTSFLLESLRPVNIIIPALIDVLNAERL